jgi:hypothetical protein
MMHLAFLALATSVASAGWAIVKQIRTWGVGDLADGLLHLVVHGQHPPFSGHGGPWHDPRQPRRLLTATWSVRVFTACGRSLCVLVLIPLFLLSPLLPAAGSSNALASDAVEAARQPLLDAGGLHRIERCELFLPSGRRGAALYEGGR